MDEPITPVEPEAPVERRAPLDRRPPAANRPFGHAMTLRAQDVTVPVRDVTPAPQVPRHIPVQNGDATATGIDVPIVNADDEAVA